MGVRKIFIVLITIVACVILGAFVLNTLMPNVVTQMINAVEGMIFNATSLSFDFNGDGVVGAETDGAFGTDENLVEGNQDDYTGNLAGFDAATQAGG